MKKKADVILKSILAVIAVIISAVMPITAHADDKLTVNGVEVNKGDTVTYECYVGGVEDTVAGAGCYIRYDTSYLEYIDGSIGFDVFNNAMHNITDGVIYYSAVNAYGYDLKSEKLVVTISFKVLDTAQGSTTIEHTFDEFFTLENEDTDLTEDQYTAREVVTVNSYEQNTAPYLGTDANEMQEYMVSDTFDINDLFNGVPNENASSAVHSTINVTSQSSESSEAQAESSSGNVILVVIIVVFCLAAAGAAAYVIVGKKKK